MEKTLIEQHIAKALDRNPFCTFATVENNKPKLRYMAIYNQGLSIYLATNSRTHKVEELEKNNQVALLFGYEAGGTKEVVEIEGTASVKDDTDLKHKIWNDDLKQWFEGPDDPSYVILQITPKRIEYTDQEGNKREWLE